MPEFNGVSPYFLDIETDYDYPIGKYLKVIPKGLSKTDGVNGVITVNQNVEIKLKDDYNQSSEGDQIKLDTALELYENALQIYKLLVNKRGYNQNLIVNEDLEISDPNYNNGQVEVSMLLTVKFRRIL